LSITRESHALYAAFEAAVAAALVEDLGEIDVDADVTTKSVVPDDLRGSATVYAKQSGVLCGIDALRMTYAQLDPDVAVSLERKDGDEIEPGESIAAIDGPVAAILVGERSALNLIGHLSGIATTVRAFARAAPGTTLTDTRKTLPGLRLLQKYAVRVGGGENHRFALWDGVLIKDNHIVAAGGVGDAVKRAKATSAVPVQAECTSRQEVDEALDAGAMALLLDNRSPDELVELVQHIRSRAEHVMIEASGGVTLENVAEIAKSGVDRISVGAFTHSAPSLDVSMKLGRVWRQS
jgi:nicotinate-nucleotide pyrophosphorylase (carboxylating)